jgi:hypothetical protein
VGNFFAQTIKIRGENDGIFGWGFLGFPHSQSMFYTLMVYSSTKGLVVVGVFIQFQDFPSCFGVNDGVEHAACSVANSCLCRGYTQVKTEHQFVS